MGGFVAVTILCKPFDESLKSCHVNVIEWGTAEKEVGGSCHVMTLSLKGRVQRERWKIAGSMQRKMSENSEIHLRGEKKKTCWIWMTDIPLCTPVCVCSCLCGCKCAGVNYGAVDVRSFPCSCMVVYLELSVIWDKERKRGAGRWWWRQTMEVADSREQDGALMEGWQKHTERGMWGGERRGTGWEKRESPWEGQLEKWLSWRSQGWLSCNTIKALGCVYLL